MSAKGPVSAPSKNPASPEEILENLEIEKSEVCEFMAPNTSGDERRLVAISDGAQGSMQFAMKTEVRVIEGGPSVQVKTNP